jgi:hypothetical protein
VCAKRDLNANGSISKSLIRALDFGCSMSYAWFMSKVGALVTAFDYSHYTNLKEDIHNALKD